MNDVMSTAKTQPGQELFIKMVLAAWDTHIARINKLLDELSDEILAAPVAPGRNTGTYILGHLVAVHDGMLPILGLGDKLYPQLEPIFLTNPDNTDTAKPAAQELRQYWTAVSAKLSQQIATMPADEWFNRHTAVSEADFAKEPHRNKLNILINRTNHLSYHWGQLVFLKPKK
jgi:uncharacterized damage-inducible protein DinB